CDVKGAGRAGVCSLHFPEGNLGRYESILTKYGQTTDGIASLLAGASRLARLATVANNPQERALRDIAAGLVAPVLISYVFWILQRARRGGVRRLYFLARDGQILIGIARRLMPMVYPECDVRYLYASRQAWHVPALEKIGARELEGILDATDHLSVRAVLGRVGLAPEKLQEVLSEHGYPCSVWDRNLKPEERDGLAGLLKSRDAEDAIRTSTGALREVLFQYLSQEG